MTPNRTLLARHLRPMSPLPTGLAPVLRRWKPYAAILFDVYGTLLISDAGEIAVERGSTADRTALDALLRRHAVDPPPELISARLRRSIAESHAVSRRRGIDWPEVDILEIWGRVLGTDCAAGIADFALEYELIVNPVYPMPGMRDLLAACRSDHIVMGIVSNAQFYTPLVLEWILGAPLPEWGFDPRLLLYSWREKHAKPSPVMFERARSALRAMAIPADAVLYVGNDMRNDILPAAGVGFRTALFAGDRRSLRRRATDAGCRERTPDLIVTDLRQLIAGRVDGEA